MKRYYSLLMALVLVFMTAQAANFKYVGYCDGKIASDQAGYILGKAGKGTVECAVRLSADMFAEASGSQVTAVRVGFPEGELPAGITVWVRESLDGENIAQGSAATVAAGWNLVNLDKPVDPFCGKDYFYGYTFEQSKKINCISSVGAARTDGYWIAKNAKWQDLSGNDSGCLSIEAVATGGDIIGDDITLEKCTLTPNKVVIGQPATLSGVVVNNGSNTLTGYTIRATVNGSEIYNQAFDATLTYREELPFSVEFPTAGLPEMEDGVEVAIEVSFANASISDQDPANNTVTVPLYAFAEAFPRNILYEEFATEPCGYCPDAADRVKKVVADNGWEDHFVYVGHHCGYLYDWLLLDESQEYLWFFSGGGFSPASLADRVRFDKYCSMGTAIFNPSNEEMVTNILKERYDTPAWVNLEGTAAVNDNGKIDIHLDGRFRGDPENCERLTVFICESGIMAHNQNGRYGQEYIHEPVIRAMVTDPWGQQTEWNGRQMSVDLNDVELNAEWKQENLYIAAFLSNYDPEDKLNCHVANAVKIPLKTNSSVEGIATEGAPVAVEYFDLAGARVAAPAEGVYVERTTYANGTVSTQKVIVK